MPEVADVPGRIRRNGAAEYAAGAVGGAPPRVAGGDGGRSGPEGRAPLPGTAVSGPWRAPDGHRYAAVSRAAGGPAVPAGPRTPGVGR